MTTHSVVLCVCVHEQHVEGPVWMYTHGPCLCPGSMPHTISQSGATDNLRSLWMKGKASMELVLVVTYGHGLMTVSFVSYKSNGVGVLFSSFKGWFPLVPLWCISIALTQENEKSTIQHHMDAQSPSELNGQFICSAPSMGRLQNCRENKMNRLSIQFPKFQFGGPD